MYKTIRKVLIMFLLVSTLVCGALFAVACTHGHTHNYGYVSDGEAGHHQECKDCDDVRSEILPHNYNNDDVCTSCGYHKGAGSELIALAKPTGLNVKDGILTWNAVEHAVDYEIKADGAFVTTVSADDPEGLKFDLKKTQLSVGNHSVTVTAIGDGETYGVSPESDSVTYTVEPVETPEPKKLDAPTGLKIEDGILTWDAVEYAVDYEIKADGSFVATVAADDPEGLKADLKKAQLSVGNHSVTVTAIGDDVFYTDSDASAPVTYKVAGQLPAPTGVALKVDILSWDAVNYADGYKIYDGENLVATVDGDGELKVDLSEKILTEGEHQVSVSAYSDDEDYEESERSAPVTYKVVPVVTPQGGTEHWVEEGMGAGTSWRHVAGDPYEITSGGKYSIPVKYEIKRGSEDMGDWTWEYTDFVSQVDLIKFTAPLAGKHAYIFSWNGDDYGLNYLNDVEDFELEDVCVFYDDENYKLIFVLEENEEIKLALRYIYSGNAEFLTGDEEFSYVLTIEEGEEVTAGSLYDPIEVTQFEDTHTADGLTKAYFKLPVNTLEDAYEITFTGDLKVYILQYGLKSADVVENEDNAVSSGYIFIPSSVGMTYIYVVAANGVDISFTLTKSIMPGSAENPIVMELGVEMNYTFMTWSDAWAKFDVSEAGFYRFTVETTSIVIYSSLDVDTAEGSGQLGDIIYSDSLKNDLYLTVGTIYIKLAYSGESVSLTITKTPNEDGNISNPHELSLGNYNLSTSGSAMYFKYVPSFTGKLKVNHDAFAGVIVYAYSDSVFTTPYVTGTDDGYDEEFTLDVTKDVTVYFFVNAEYAIYGEDQDYAHMDTVVITLTGTLAKPTLTVNDNTKKATWTAVAGATSYVIYSGNDILASNVTALEYDLSGLAPGVYTIYVEAIGDGENLLASGKSSSKSYKYEVQLAAPTNAKVEDGKLVWDEVENATSYRIRVDDAKSNTYKTVYTNSFEDLLDSSFVTEGAHTFYITACGPNGYTESEAVSVQYTVVFPADFEIGQEYDVTHLAAYTIKFEGGKTYTVILSGDYADHFIVRDTGDGHTWTLKSNQSNVAGDLIIPGATSLAVAFEVPADKGGTYNIRFVDNEAFTDPEHSSHSCKVQFVEGDHSVAFEGPKEFTLDEELEVNLKAFETVDYTFNSSLPGLYNISLKDISGSYTVKVNNGSVTFIDTKDSAQIDGDWSETEGTFEDKTVYLAGEVDFNKFTITFYSGSTVKVKVLITYVRPGDRTLVLDAEPVYGAISGQSETDADDLDTSKVGKLIISNLVAGQKYTIIMTELNNQSSDHRLVYNGKTYTSYLSENHNATCISFEAEAGENDAYIYSIVASGKVGTCKLKLVNYIEGDEPANENGPAQGESKWLVTGGSEGNAAELKFSSDFVVGGTYTIAITDSEKEEETPLWWSATYILVYGAGKTVEFDYANGDYSHKEATFVAEGSPVKVYSLNGRGSANPLNTKFEIISVVLPEDNGLKVGNSVTVDLSTTAIDIELSSKLVAGQKYILKMGWNINVINGGKFVYNGNELTVNADIETESVTVEFTAVEGVNVIKASLLLGTASGVTITLLKV